MAGHDRETGGFTTGKVERHGTCRRVELKTEMGTGWTSKLRAWIYKCGDGWFWWLRDTGFILSMIIEWKDGRPKYKGECN